VMRPGWRSVITQVRADLTRLADQTVVSVDDRIAMDTTQQRRDIASPSLRFLGLGPILIPRMI
jgi:hypothetical protein